MRINNNVVRRFAYGTRPSMFSITDPAVDHSVFTLAPRTALRPPVKPICPISEAIAQALQVRALQPKPVITIKAVYVPPFIPQQQGMPRNLRMREDALMLAKMNREYLASKKNRPDVYQHSLRDHRIGEVA